MEITQENKEEGEESENLNQQNNDDKRVLYYSTLNEINPQKDKLIYNIEDLPFGGSNINDIQDLENSILNIQAKIRLLKSKYDQSVKKNEQLSELRDNEKKQKDKDFYSKKISENSIKVIGYKSKIDILKQQLKNYRQQLLLLEDFDLADIDLYTLYEWLLKREILNYSRQEFKRILKELREKLRNQRYESHTGKSIKQSFNFDKTKDLELFQRKNTDIFLYYFMLYVFSLTEGSTIYLNIQFKINIDGVEQEEGVGTQIQYNGKSENYKTLKVFDEWYKSKIRELEERYDCEIEYLESIRIAKKVSFSDDLISKIKAFTVRDDNSIKKYSKIGLVCGRDTKNELEQKLCLYESYLSELFINGELDINKEENKKLFLGHQNIHTQNKRKRLILEHFNKEPKELKDYIINGELKLFIDYINKNREQKISVYLSYDKTYYPNDKIKNIMIYKDCHVIPTTHELINLYELEKECKARRRKEGYHLTYKLTPLKKSKEMDLSKSYTWDIESYIIDEKGTQRPTLICLYGKNKKELKECFKGLDCVKLFIDYIHKNFVKIGKTKGNESKKKDYYHFWSHNGSNYDNSLIIKECLRKYVKVNHIGTPTSLRQLKYHNIVFLDFRKLFLGSLNSLSKSWLNEEKEDFDPTIVTKYNWELFVNMNEKKAVTDYEKYCLKDCELLYRLVEKYYNLISKQDLNGVKFKDLCQMSASSLAMKIFRRCYLNKTIYSSQIDIQESEREAYYGGMNVTLKRELKHGYYYDINSSYPASMLKLMPIQYLGNIIFDNEIKITNKDSLLLDEGELIEHYLYFCKFKFNEDVLIPNLPVKTKTQTQYPPSDEIIRPRWGIDLIEALKSGCELTIYKYYKYEGEAIFKDFVEKIYGKRLSSKQKQSEYKKKLQELEKLHDELMKGHIDNLGLAETEEEIRLCKNQINEQGSLIDFWKLLLNSIYGKTGQKIYDRSVIGNIDRIEEVLKMKGARETNWDWLNHNDPEEEEIYIVTYNTDHYETEEIGGLVRFASYITACSRSNLISSAREVGFEHCAYFDTDSIFCDIPFPEHLIDNFKLGKWKLEGEIYNGLFCGNKTYTYTTKADTRLDLPSEYEIDNWDKLECFGSDELYEQLKKEKEELLKVYGNKESPNIVLKSKGINKKLMCYQDYIRMNKGETVIKVNQSQFFKKFGSIEVRPQEKRIKQSGNRQFLYNGTSIPSDKIYESISDIPNINQMLDKLSLYPNLSKKYLDEMKKIYIIQKQKEKLYDAHLRTNRFGIYDIELLTEIEPIDIEIDDIFDDDINKEDKIESDLESDEYISSDEDLESDNEILLKELEKEDKKIHKKEIKLKYYKKDVIQLNYEKRIKEIEEEEEIDKEDEDYEMIQFMNSGGRQLK
jgi:hypothetical protein